MKIGKHARDYDLDPGIEEHRNIMRSTIEDIVLNRTSKKVGSWRGQEGEVYFYIKGEDVVVTKKTGEFITILKGGTENARVKNARNA